MEPKQELTETAENKPEIKVEPKEEEDSGANSTSATSAQNRRKGRNRDDDDDDVYGVSSENKIQHILLIKKFTAIGYNYSALVFPSNLCWVSLNIFNNLPSF